MKKLITLFSFLVISCVTYAQKIVKAEDIIRDIKSGKDIVLKNVTVDGTLDFTYMEAKLRDLPKKRRWWNNGGSNTIENLIETKISFENVIFKDNVLAYIPDGYDSGYTFTASFDDDIIFKNCHFEGKAMFKYSKFESNTSFKGAKFDEDTTFKYAKFEMFVSFIDANFEESATFKYAEFKDGVSFKNANFEEDLNIKYMKVKGDFDISEMRVAYDIDSKYTQINGSGFTSYLLKNN